MPEQLVVFLKNMLFSKASIIPVQKSFGDTHTADTKTVEKCRNSDSNPVSSFIFMPAISLGKVEGAAALAGLRIPHGHQQCRIIVLALHQDGAKQGP